ncbi:MAG: phytoene desaturase family protein [Frankiaceae bacterium]
MIGAGVGGLAAAARLAALGHDVTVCERAERIGGKLALVERDGFRFDAGPSLVTMPFVLEELFAATGDPLAGAVRLRRLDPVARYRFADGTELRTAADLDQLCAEIDDVLLPGSGTDWRRLLDHAARVWAATYGPVLSSPLEGWRALARQAHRLGDLRAIAPWRTLRALGRRRLRDPRLRMLLDRYATYTGSDPRRAPAALVTVPYAEQAFGGWYVDGGLHRLGQAVLDRAVERGSRVLLGAEVTGVVVDGGRVGGVRLADGSRLPADVVVSDADAAHLYGRLLPGSVAATTAPLRALRRATPSLSGFALLLGVRAGRHRPAHHSVLFPPDYDAEFDAVFGRPARPVADPTVYVTVPHDASVAPDGHEAWFVLVNAPRHGVAGDGGAIDWAAPGLAESYADRVLATMAARGLDVRDRVVLREIRTPADLERETAAPGGAIYGTSSNGVAAAFLRPANRSPVPGLFLVGGSAHPGGGLPLVVLSARIVAGLVGPA